MWAIRRRRRNNIGREAVKQGIKKLWSKRGLGWKSGTEGTYGVIF